MSDVVEIPVEVWEHCQRDAETIAFLHRENARLQAEVERLRKAGDAMAFNYEQMHGIDGVYDSDLMKFVARWNAAKEGKQS